MYGSHAIKRGCAYCAFSSKLPTTGNARLVRQQLPHAALFHREFSTLKKISSASFQGNGGKAAVFFERKETDQRLSFLAPGILIGTTLTAWYYMKKPENIDCAELPAFFGSFFPQKWHSQNNATNSEANFAESFPEASEQLKTLLKDRFSTDPSHLNEHGKEVSGYAARANPQAVLWPTSTEEVSQIVKICDKYRIPIVPYGAGTSLEGHINAIRGGITLSFSKMNKILTLHEKDMDVVVQPGLGWVELNEFLKPHGFLLGVDPAPGASIGGMCATCCSGTNAVRYGTMKDQVVNLTVVLADGTIVKTLQRPKKSSAGYDLARLFIGSEGTLGIVTEATLKVRHLPDVVEVAYVNYDTVQAATASVIEMMQKGIQLGAVELFDEVMVETVNAYSNLNLKKSPLVLFKFTGSKDHVKSDIEAVERICEKYTSHRYVWCDSEESRDKVWAARKYAFWAAQAMQPGKELMATDVAVPVSSLAKAVEDTKKDLRESFLFAPIVGHVGEGNYHVVIMFDPNDKKEYDEAHRLNERMVRRALELEGTCTGEHGVGQGKMKYLEEELGVSAVELMKKLKRAMDPKNILNPGKVVSIDSRV